MGGVEQRRSHSDSRGSSSHPQFHSSYAPSLCVCSNWKGRESAKNEAKYEWHVAWTIYGHVPRSSLNLPWHLRFDLGSGVTLNILAFPTKNSLFLLVFFSIGEYAQNKCCKKAQYPALVRVVSIFLCLFSRWTLLPVSLPGLSGSSKSRAGNITAHTNNDTRAP